MQLTRRDFLHSSGSLALAGWSLSSFPSLLWGADTVKASQLIAGKSDQMQVLSTDPKVMQTPLSALQEHRFTPKSLLFVRNNSEPDGAATTEPAPRAGWSVELTGLLQGEKSITADELTQLPQHEIEMVLQCSGNGRSMFSKAAQTSGTQWGRGGIGNVRFGGVKLTDVLETLQVQPRKLARYVAAEGKDDPRPGSQDFEHSLPIGDVLEYSILALTLNGDPLPAIHGGPVRLVTPGYYGTVQMKWLTRLRFEEGESTNHNHAVRYRTPDRPIQPGSKFDFSLDNSSPTWRMKTASMVTSHEDGQRVRAGTIQLKGYAWNDGSAPLTAVLASTDHGATWRRVRLGLAKSPYAWSHWTAAVNLARGENAVWIAAVDALGRTQPIEGAIDWNPRGYEWNGIEKLTLVGE